MHNRIRIANRRVRRQPRDEYIAKLELKCENAAKIFDTYAAHHEAKGDVEKMNANIAAAKQLRS